MSSTQTIWITGASSGIGKALALGWAKEGSELILSGRDRERLDEVAQEVGAAGGGKTLVLPFEVTDRAPAFDRMLVDRASLVPAEGLGLAETDSGKDRGTHERSSTLTVSAIQSRTVPSAPSPRNTSLAAMAKPASR